MRVLLDECVDEQLRHHFPGHECQTARYAGFAGLENGELLTADFGCGTAPSSRGDHSSLPDRGKDVQRGIFTTVVTGGFRSKGDPPGQQCENPRIGGADTAFAIRVRRSARMEAGILPDPGRVRFSESSRSGQADHHGQNCLERHAQESSRDRISDLQLAARVLYSAE